MSTLLRMLILMVLSIKSSLELKENGNLSMFPKKHPQVKAEISKRCGKKQN